MKKESNRDPLFRNKNARGSGLGVPSSGNDGQTAFHVRDESGQSIVNAPASTLEAGLRLRRGVFEAQQRNTVDMHAFQEEVYNETATYLREKFPEVGGVSLSADEQGIWCVSASNRNGNLMDDGDRDRIEAALNEDLPDTAYIAFADAVSLNVNPSRYAPEPGEDLATYTARFVPAMLAGADIADGDLGEARDSMIELARNEYHESLHQRLKDGETVTGAQLEGLPFTQARYLRHGYRNQIVNDRAGVDRPFETADEFFNHSEPAMTFNAKDRRITESYEIACDENGNRVLVEVSVSHRKHMPGDYTGTSAANYSGSITTVTEKPTDHGWTVRSTIPMEDGVRFAPVPSGRYSEKNLRAHLAVIREELRENWDHPQVQQVFTRASVHARHMDDDEV